MGRIGPDVLASLFDDHAAALTLYARQWCDTPEDVVQDAFLRLVRQSGGVDQIVPWLYRTVRNVAISASRSTGRRRRREASVAAAEAWFSCTDDRIDASRAAAMMSELEPDVREVIVARLWGGLKFEEIATLQGCAVSTVHKRYHTGLARLHERLETPCRTTDPTPSAT